MYIFVPRKCFAVREIGAYDTVCVNHNRHPLIAPAATIRGKSDLLGDTPKTSPDEKVGGFATK